VIHLDASGSHDPDGDRLEIEWLPYPDAPAGQATWAWQADGPRIQVTAPGEHEPATRHFVVRVCDRGEPPLARYARVAMVIAP
jgi:hypothetical protein